MHLKSRAWYFDCPLEFTLLREEHLKRSIDAQEVVPQYDDFIGLDEDARTKSMKKKEEANKRIVMRNSEAVDKAL